MYFPRWRDLHFPNVNPGSIGKCLHFFFTNAADPPSLGRPLSSISVAAKQPKTDQSKLGQPQKEKM